MFDRRYFLQGVALAATSPLLASGVTQAQPVTESFEAAFAAYVQDEAGLEWARRARELAYRDSSITEAQKGMRGRASSRQIAQPAVDLIMASEITSQAVYQAKYRRPVWPKGNSGVTIGIGYDLGYVTPSAFGQDWQGLLKDEQMYKLKPACRQKASKAAEILPKCQDVEIDWNHALEQFQRFLPYIVAETEDTFPNCDQLSDLSLGALVSLVYNRGSSIPSLQEIERDDRRREMYQIKQLMEQREFQDVSEQIRSMKRVWENNPDARGLLSRRELEAQLFEAGL